MGKGDPLDSECNEFEECLQSLEWTDTAGTQTIDLESFFENTLTSSGSFDLTGVNTGVLAKLLQSLPVPAFLLNPRLDIVLANQACSYIDWRYKDISGKPFCSLFVNACLGNEIQELLQGDFSSQKYQVYADLQLCESRIWGRMSFRPLRIKEFRSILVLVEDLTAEQKKLLLAEKYHEELNKEITERQRTEEDLRKSEEKYRNIIETIQDGYYESDIAGNFISFNDNVCEIMGYSRQEFQNINYRKLVDEENANKIYLVFAKIYAGKPPKKIFDHEITRKDGTKRNVTISISLVKDSSGLPIGFRGICRDITERKRAVNHFARMEKLESIGVLAGGIAHDFNNILTSILGNIALSRMSSQSRDNINQRLQEAEKAIDRARHLTQQLLTFSRGGAPVKQTASISEMVRDTCEFAGRGSNVRCEFSIPDNIYSGDVDMGQISQVISNLIINAEQAMPDGGVIHVRLENVSINNRDELPLKEGKYLKLSIQDHGIGIPAKILPKIFDPYFTTKQEGSGLGLASAYSIIKSHDGLITVESEAGMGTVFHIHLPVSDKAMAGHKDSERGIIAGEGKILLMDDEEMIRDMGKEMLTLLGYDVDVAGDGDEAIEFFRLRKNSGDPYLAVILDLTVRGGMGGRETLLRLVELEPTIKAIVSSGYSNDPIMSDYKKYGFSGVVVKPYSPEELSRTLDRVIKRPVQ